MRSITSLFAAIFIFASAHGASAKLVKFTDIEAFLAAANRDIARGDYDGFVKKMNVQASQASAAEALVSFLEKSFGTGGARMSVFFRRDSGDEGAQLFGAIWEDNDYAYFSITGHKRPDGFMVVHFGFESSFSSIAEKYL